MEIGDSCQPGDLQGLLKHKKWKRLQITFQIDLQ